MAKEKEATASRVGALFQFGVYKRSQGRIARQLTFLTIVVVLALGAWRWSAYFIDSQPWFRYAVPAAVLIVGGLLAFRLVNMPRFADFLIAVEAEMAKVSWPTRSELFRSAAVVIVVIVMLAAILAIYDIIWQFLLKAIGV